MPLEMGLSSKITFGKHKGSTIKEVIEDDPSYIEWATDEIEQFELDNEAQTALVQALGQGDPLQIEFKSSK